MSPVLRRGGPAHTTNPGSRRGFFLGYRYLTKSKFHVAGSPPRRTGPPRRTCPLRRNEPHHIQESFIVQLRFGFTPGVFWGIVTT